jgi:hypothetical protein
MTKGDPVDEAKIRELATNIQRDAGLIIAELDGDTPEPPEPPSGEVVHVRPGDDVGAAIRSLYATGGTIACAPGDYPMQFWHEERAVNERIVLTTDTANLPKPDERITPDYLPGLAVFRSENGLDSVITANRRSGGLHCVGVAFGPQQFDRTVISLGDDTMTDPADLPTDFLFDRVVFYGDPDHGQHRGIMAHADGVAVQGCYFQDFHEQGRDAQCLSAWNGGRHIVIDNCHLEGSGENIVFGGGKAQSVEMIPQDITITRNLLLKPERWQHLASLPSIKCLFELKNVQRCWVEGNVFDGCWSSAKPGGSWGSGVAIVIKVCPNGSLFTKNEDTTFVRNVIRNVGSVFVVVGEHDGGDPSDVMKRLVMEGNLAYLVNVAGSPYPGDGKCLANGRPPFGMTFNHNTIFNTGTLFDWWWDNPSETGTDLVFTNNAANHGPYGVRSAEASGTACLDLGWPNQYQFTSNAIRKHPDRTVKLPPGNVIIEGEAFDASFYGDRSVIPGSAVAEVATTDGEMIGADLEAIANALAPTEAIDDYETRR